MYIYIYICMYAYVCIIYIYIYICPYIIYISLSLSLSRALSLSLSLWAFRASSPGSLPSPCCAAESSCCKEGKEDMEFRVRGMGQGGPPMDLQGVQQVTEVLVL